MDTRTLLTLRETYYEVYLDGTLYHEGTLESCTEYALRVTDSLMGLAEVYKVTVTEEKVIV